MQDVCIIDLLGIADRLKYKQSRSHNRTGRQVWFSVTSNKLSNPAPFLRLYITQYTMRCSIIIAAALPLVQGVRIIQSNDDGWAEINLRTMFNVLNAAGHEAVLSGPAENQSGKGTQSIRKMPNQIAYISRFIRCHTQDG